MRIASLSAGVVALSAVWLGCGMTHDFASTSKEGTNVPPEPAPEAAPPLVPGPASEGHGAWELVNPQPVATNLYGAWGTSQSDVWLVGQEGMVYRYDGSKVVPAHQGPVNDVYVNVWASAPDDVWVTGQRGTAKDAPGVVLHHDGATWKVDPQIGTQKVHALFGFAKNDVWAAVDDGKIFHFDGTWTQRFQAVNARTVRTVWGTSPSDVWFAGDLGYLAHYDGTALHVLGADSFASDPGQLGAFGIWGEGPDDVWLFAGDQFRRTQVFHWDGAVWSNKATGGCLGEHPVANELYRGGRRAWGARINGGLTLAASPDGRCVVAYRDRAGIEGTWELPAIRPVDEDRARPYTAFWGAKTDNFGSLPLTLLSVGEGGHMSQSSNPQLEFGLEPLFPGYRRDLSGVSVGADEVWAIAEQSWDGGNRTFSPVRWTSMGWTPVLVPNDARVIAVGARSASDVWIATFEDLGGVSSTSAMRHWDGTKWSSPTFLKEGIWRIAFAPDGTAWGVGDHVVAHFTGGAWTKLPTRVSPVDVTFPSADAPVFVTSYCSVLRWNGAALEELFTVPGKDVWCDGVYAESPTSIFVAGHETWHWDGGALTKLPVDTWTTSVWGTGGAVFFTAEREQGGSAGDIVRWDGAALSTVARASSKLTLAGSGDAAFAVGAYGSTLRYRLPDPKPAR